jgi:hypothetical protein
MRHARLDDDAAIFGSASHQQAKVIGGDPRTESAVPFSTVA